jgi:hypothetical protein
MNRILPLTALVLLPAVWPLLGGSEPASIAPDRDIATLVPERCSVFVEGTGLAPLLELGFEHPLVSCFSASPLGQFLQQRFASEEYLGQADKWLGESLLSALGALSRRGLALGVDAGAKKGVLVVRGAEAGRVQELQERIFARIETALGWPGGLDRPAQLWHGGEVWFLGELVVARREALLAAGNDAELVRAVLALAADPGGRGLLARPGFAALHGARTGSEALWAWADLEALEPQADQGFRALRASSRSPAMQSLFGARIAALTSSASLAAWLALGDERLVLGLRGSAATSAEPLEPGASPGALVPPKLPAGQDLVQALVYRDYGALFEHRSELFPSEDQPGFAEAITSAALFFGGQDLGADVLAHVSPWLRVVVRPARFRPGLEPEIPLPALAIVAALEDEQRLGPEFVSAFQSLVSIVNIDRAQKGGGSLLLALGRAGEVELTSARFLAPAAGAGVDLRYNLEPACAVVGQCLVLGTHESLVRELVRDLAQADVGVACTETHEWLELDGSSVAAAFAANSAALVARKMLAEGLAQEQAEQEVAGLLLALDSIERARAELGGGDPRMPELRLELELACPAAEPAR